ncbi:hypothetical protein EDEG_04025 [Edhazardia aedis USNM 41457]|uniref:Uncharacterized protein n=1 Tax=Edhazardia aedis (strain USNM 41457) TaxID=1003232 RepID=J8ZNQ4_EDHAE|nr:hypothetical protein EDEG_04025 [Edhazardia aedis USNM 41457]|eukprot:EJW01318.1 hypothetical protein EDEG_04025 [Edhazardia aedis USNM 41457]
MFNEYNKYIEYCEMLTHAMKTNNLKTNSEHLSKSVINLYDLIKILIKKARKLDFIVDLIMKRIINADKILTNTCNLNKVNMYGPLSPKSSHCLFFNESRIKEIKKFDSNMFINNDERSALSKFLNTSKKAVIKLIRNAIDLKTNLQVISNEINAKKVQENTDSAPLNDQAEYKDENYNRNFVMN